MWRVKQFVWGVAATAGISLAVAVVLGATSDPIQRSGLMYVATLPTPFLAAGVYLMWKRPTDRSARLLVGGAAATMAYAAGLEAIIHRRHVVHGVETWMSWALVVEALVMTVGVACFALLIGLFPDGLATTPRQRRFRVAMWLLPIPMLVALVANQHVLVEAFGYGGFEPFPNPIHIAALSPLGPATLSMRYIIALVLVLAIGLLLVRYRSETSRARRKVRWVLYGSATAVGVGIVPFIVEPLLDPGGGLEHGILLSLSSFALLLIPLTVVIAIEEPTWVDTDEVIRKTFAYGALSLGIFVVYAALAAALGLAAGARLPLETAIGVTAVLAFAFHPARRRLQVVADRWVFGERPSPLAAVAGFERSMQAENIDDDLGRQLAETIRRAAHLRWVTVEIPPHPPVRSGTTVGAEIYEAPIARGDERLGGIRCGQKLTGRFTDSDAELVSALAGQAALVISNARLATRIVQAQEAERRRLERNIHDGAQQELVALVAKLGLARTRAREGSLDEASLVDLQADAGTILRELRELAQGIHPSVLTDGGLVEAVEDRCSRLPIGVVVEASAGLRSVRFDDDVEGAAYFFVTEALANVLKHAAATQVEISLTRRNGNLDLRVADNGHGFDPATTTRTGLTGLSDRFSALFGTVSVTGSPGNGTIVEGRIPIDGAIR